MMQTTDVSEYFLVINGKPEGPFNMEQLMKLHIKPEDFIKTPDMPDYKEAHELAELRQIFHFQKRSVAPQYFAGLDQRLLASAIDWLMISGFYIVFAFAAVLLITESSLRIIVALSIIALIPITNFVYHIILESSDKQGTYGKQVLKIKVCDMEGERITNGKAITRNFLKLVSWITVVGFLLSFFNKKQQCLHDMMAETLVMKDRLI